MSEAQEAQVAESSNDSIFADSSSSEAVKAAVDELARIHGGMGEEEEVAEDVQELEASDNQEDVEEEKPELEAKPEEEEEVQDPLSKKFAALSRREKAIREKEKALESRMQELEQKLQGMQQPEQAKQQEQAVQEPSIEELLKKSPMKALEKYGWDMNRLAETLLSDGKLPIDMQMQLMREEIKNELKSETDALRKQLADKDEAESAAKDQKIIENFKSEITDYVSGNEEKYEFIVASGNEDMIYETIQEYYNSHNEVLPTEEAADLVEAYLEEQAKGVFMKTKKARSYLQSESQEKPITQSSKQAKSPTLTNQASGTVPSSEKPILSDEESLREAAKQLIWRE